MRVIFISYRREDSEGHAGRLLSDLARHFGDRSVFMDVAGIEPGRDFRRVIEDHIASCSVLLVIIGKRWIDARDASGQRRLDDPTDLVRLEIAAALKRDIPVVPVLVQEAQIPRPEQLPPDVVGLVYRHAVELTHARWHSDVEVLINALRPHLDGLQHDPARADTGLHSVSPDANETSRRERRRSRLFAHPVNRAVAGIAAALALSGGVYVWYQNSRSVEELPPKRTSTSSVGAPRNVATDAPTSNQDSGQCPALAAACGVVEIAAPLLLLR